jgi:hypothetical protein
MRSRVTPSLALLTVVLIVVAGLIAIPVLAASPSPAPSASPAATAQPSTDSDHDGNADRQKATDKVKKDHQPEVAVTLSGTLGTVTSADGETDYTLTVGSTTYTLEAGPAWYWGDKHPLKAYVGKAVTVVGEQEQGATSVDVQSVDGKQIREPGKPLWAGGPMRVGKDHPGWSQDKADRAAQKAADMKARFGVDCWPPGHCKDASGKPQTPNPTATPTP